MKIRLLLLSPFLALMAPGNLPAQDAFPDIDSNQPTLGEQLSRKLPEAEKAATPTPTPRSSSPKATPRPPVKKTPAKPAPAPAPAQPGPAVVGKSFINSDGLEMEFRKTDDRGRPFWRSRVAVLSADSRVAQEYCRRLTETETLSQLIPAGYAYLPSIAGDGKMVLAVAQVYEVPGSNASSVSPAVSAPSSASPPSASPGLPVEKQAFTNGAGLRMEWRQLKTMGYWVYAGPIDPGTFARAMNNPQSKWPGDIARAGALMAGKLDPDERAAGRVPPGWGYRMRNQTELCLLPL